MKISGIYKIINKVNGKYYIGSSINIHKRWNQHKSNLRWNKHTNPHFQNAWNKYGEKNFDFTVVEEMSSNKLILTEQKYLDELKSKKDKCYNVSFIADKIEMSDEIKEKISKMNKGRKHSLQSRLNMGHSHIGIKHSEKWIENFRKSTTGRKQSNETKLKISMSMKGKLLGSKNPMFDIHRYGKNNPMFGKHHTKETKEKIKSSLKNRILSY